MEFYAFKDGKKIAKERIMSVGGGQIVIEGKPELDEEDIYELRTFGQIADYCTSKNMRLYEFVEENEGTEIWEFLHEIWKAMKGSINTGLSTRGVLDGGLGVERKAQYLYNQSHIDESDITKENRLVCAYAFAASENNAGGGIVVTDRKAHV